MTVKKFQNENVYYSIQKNTIEKLWVSVEELLKKTERDCCVQYFNKTV